LPLPIRSRRRDHEGWQSCCRDNRPRSNSCRRTRTSRYEVWEKSQPIEPKPQLGTQQEVKIERRFSFSQNNKINVEDADRHLADLSHRYWELHFANGHRPDCPPGDVGHRSADWVCVYPVPQPEVQQASRLKQRHQ